MKKAAFVLALALTQGACGQLGTSDLDSASKLNSIAEKRTTSGEVRALLGEPAMVFTDVGGDTVWSYRRYKDSPFGAPSFVSVILQFRDGIVLSKNVNHL